MNDSYHTEFRFNITLQFNLKINFRSVIQIKVMHDLNQKMNAEI